MFTHLHNHISAINGGGHNGLSQAPITAQLQFSGPVDSGSVAASAHELHLTKLHVNIATVTA